MHITGCGVNDGVVHSCGAVRSRAFTSQTTTHAAIVTHHHLQAMLREVPDGRPVHRHPLVDLGFERDGHPEHSPRKRCRSARVEQREELDPLQEAGGRRRGVEELPRGDVDVVEDADVAVLGGQVALEEAEANLVEVALVEGGDGAVVRQGDLDAAGLGGDVDDLWGGKLWWDEGGGKRCSLSDGE